VSTNRKLNNRADDLARRYKIFSYEFRHYPPLSKLLDLRDRFCWIWSANPTVELLPGVEQFLDYLYQNHIPLYVVTGTVDAFARKLLKKCGVPGLFDRIYGVTVKRPRKRQRERIYLSKIPRKKHGVSDSQCFFW